MASWLWGGRQWIATIDTNPHRDPATSPTLYVTQRYGANSVWKSSNRGVDWTNVWDNNIFAEDGVTNISKDVGNDISGVYLVDSSGPDHLIVYLHSYYGTLGNNGIFESKDGGGTWVVHKAQTFKGVLFDGEHYVLVVPEEAGGVWRYVGP